MNSNTGSFSLAIDDGPFEDFFDDIPLSAMDWSVRVEVLRGGFIFL